MIVKDLRSIERFFVSGNYPNQRAILSSMKERLLNERARRPTGFSPPVLELYGRGGRFLGETEIRELDLPFLCQKDFKKALDYCRLIFSARNRSAPSQQKMRRLINDYYQEWRYFFRNVPRQGDDCVVPCTSPDRYSKKITGDKGATLLSLSQQGYPVPDFVILTANVYRKKPPERQKKIETAVHDLERLTAQTLGSATYPMIFAIRCAMPSYMPGIMPTYLNAGVTENAFPALVLYYGQEAASRIFLNNLKNMLRAVDQSGFASLFLRPKAPPENLNSLLGQLFDRVKKKDPDLLQDPYYQTDFFVRQAYKYFESNLDLLTTFSKGETHFPSLILQNMICTVRNKNSQVGVLYSRHPRTGECKQIEHATNIFGEEIMAGTVETEKTNFTERAEIKADFPAVYHFSAALTGLERHFQSPVTIEFATDFTDRQEFFALLQLNRSEMTGRGAFIAVMELHKRGIIPQRRVPELIKPYQIKQIESDTIDPESFKELVHFSSGVSLLPRTAVTAQVFFTPEAALAQKKMGHKVCLCKKAFEPSDTAVMREMDAILSLTSAAIHVVTICQSYGLPGLINLEKKGITWSAGRRLVNPDGLVIREGDWVTVSSYRRALYLGKAKFKSARLLRYMKGEAVELDEAEKPAFASMARAYRAYNELIASLKLEQISSLREIIRLAILEFRGETEKAKELVNKWFDGHRTIYVKDVLRSEMGDHLKQHAVFNLLTPDRKIRFFKDALRRCVQTKKYGYSAGTFMLGRFICLRQPVRFWTSFSPSEIAVLINEWILFEKYMHLLDEIGDGKIARAKKKILEGGMKTILINTESVKTLITLKLSGVSLNEIKKEIPGWCDAQTSEAVELLQQPYSAIYPEDEPWSLQELSATCAAEQVPIPDLGSK